MSNPWIQTRSGKAVDLLNPIYSDHEALLEDIAWSLSHICRFNGHSAQHYSVAEHSVLIADCLLEKTGSKRLALAGLMHDCAEYATGDISSPMQLALERLVPGFKEGFKGLTRRHEDDILRCLGLDKLCIPGDEYPGLNLHHGDVRATDLRILVDERAVLFDAPPQPWTSIEGLQPLSVSLQGWSPERARWEWLDRFEKLTGSVVAKGPKPAPPRKDLARLQDRIRTALGISVSGILRAIEELKATNQELKAHLEEARAYRDNAVDHASKLLDERTQQGQNTREALTFAEAALNRAKAKLAVAEAEVFTLREQLAYTKAQRDGLMAGAERFQPTFAEAQRADRVVRDLDTMSDLILQMKEAVDFDPNDERSLIEQAPDVVRETLNELRKVTSDADRATIADLTSRLDELRRVVGVTRG